MNNIKYKNTNTDKTSETKLQHFKESPVNIDYSTSDPLFKGSIVSEPVAQMDNQMVSNGEPLVCMPPMEKQ